MVSVSNRNGGFNREVEEVQQMVSGPIQCSMDDLADRAKAFDMFPELKSKNERMSKGIRHSPTVTILERAN